MLCDFCHASSLKRQPQPHPVVHLILQRQLHGPQGVIQVRKRDRGRWTGADGKEASKSYALNAMNNKQQNHIQAKDKPSLSYALDSGQPNNESTLLRIVQNIFDCYAN